MDAEEKDAIKDAAGNFLLENLHCDTVYVIAKRGFCNSDVHRLSELIPFDDERQIVVLGDGMSRGLMDYIRTKFRRAVVVS